MDRVWIAGGANGKIQVLLGSAAVKERRRVGRQIDDTIARALRGEIVEDEGDGFESVVRFLEQLKLV